MRTLVAAFVLLAMLVGPAFAQGPDLSPVTRPLNDLAGQAVPPALTALYAATGNNITREDVRITLDMNFTKGDVGLAGLLIGSGKAEIQAKIQGRLEMRVISSDRVRAALEGENAYNIDAGNATFLSQAYLPAEVFRASASAEVVAAFQRDQEDALHAYLTRALPEMDILKLDFIWSNVHPYQTTSDASLTEPPIVLELDLVLQYIRVESVNSLVKAYFDKDKKGDDGRKAYVEDLKQDNGDPLRTRDFFAAAAYTQLLNLSMQPGWTLDITLALPQGYSFTYFNDQVERVSDRKASLHVDASSSDEEVGKVFLAAITHRRLVALVLFGALWVVGLLAAFPLRFVYGRQRVLRLKR